MAVAHVHDGDTVRLEDGRRVRLIGLDTPELGRDGRPSEAHAERAREHVRDLVGGDVRLHAGLDASDRHGRTLAHLVLADGRNLQVSLLEAGLAVVVAVPPNLRLLDCYRAAENRARAAARGVWRDGAFGPLRADTLAPGSRGFRLVRGVVQRIGHSRRSLWLEMGPRFSARLARRGLSDAERRFVESLAGREITVRGYLFGDGRRLHVTVGHPSLIELP